MHLRNSFPSKKEGSPHVPYKNIHFVWKQSANRRINEVHNKNSPFIHAKSINWSFGRIYTKIVKNIFFRLILWFFIEFHKKMNLEKHFGSRWKNASFGGVTWNDRSNLIHIFSILDHQFSLLQPIDLVRMLHLNSLASDKQNRKKIIFLSKNDNHVQNFVRRLVNSVFSSKNFTFPNVLKSFFTIQLATVLIWSRSLDWIFSNLAAMAQKLLERVRKNGHFEIFTIFWARKRNFSSIMSILNL